MIRRALLLTFRVMLPTQLPYSQGTHFLSNGLSKSFMEKTEVMGWDLWELPQTNARLSDLASSVAPEHSGSSLQPAITQYSGFHAFQLLRELAPALTTPLLNPPLLLLHAAFPQRRGGWKPISFPHVVLQLLAQYVLILKAEPFLVLVMAPCQGEQWPGIPFLVLGPSPQPLEKLLFSHYTGGRN